MRTISAMVGKGSVNHNSRNFTAENVDPERTRFNIDYLSEPIKKVYHKLFDEALKKYNEKQKRADRRIEDYYEKISTGRQEKPFHEVILQIGNFEDMNAQSENGQLAKQILDEYYRGFQERNPRLYVFSAHLHMDEATPHIHIDFVPFTTGSERGLETRVSLKQALAAQGFQGGKKQYTEWNGWVQSEKEHLAAVMERHGIEWEQKGTHEKHISVYEYEKKMRAQEVEELTEKAEKLKKEIDDSEHTMNAFSERISGFESGKRKLDEIEKDLSSSPEYNLPEPPTFMTAKAYKVKFVDPIIKALKELIKTILVKFFQIRSEYSRVLDNNGRLWCEGENLRYKVDRLKEENKDLRHVNSELRKQNKNHALLRKVFGSEQIDQMIIQAKELSSTGCRMRSKNKMEQEL